MGRKKSSKSGPKPAQKLASKEASKGASKSASQSASAGSGHASFLKNTRVHSTENPVLTESLVHGAHVAHLSTALFDELAPLHKLSKRWRKILDLGAKLHDIGWQYGKKAHHKNSAAIIRTGFFQNGQPLPIDVPQEIRPLVALVARYHRRADPHLSQEHFASFAKEERHAIRILASIIRLGDALDFSHTQCIKNVHVHLLEKHIQVNLVGSSPCLAEIYRIDVKKSLFHEIFKMDILCTYTKEM